MTKKLSESKSSLEYLDTTSEPLTNEMQEILNRVNEKANKKIERNNIIYDSSNMHAFEYIINNKISDEPVDFFEESRKRTR